ncbi:acetyl/propionyl/methylcrotonyl-CoA carboxylase subunit alpha [Streptomyces acidiscabies]|uniref:Biotin carboxylase N-terminal domain-containing protein n=5 Tax=Streptomyces acidiscabies TaxID=42234 RepID=A0AAP6BD36_9ACTN|nr:biotin carboxylase N-terminal domain-containing protein [Streptomyces acidiscabies]MBP5938871.1 ATP-grasp domain-containing protein [Streptomyces sp. LBUM 1476]MBZ3909990.1 ATP-grasp domain-containing protein [Streptomyces acidiscabies]MDX2962535.1 biotin carboxylase N-terminal domain-containing protein [Streptomyces acidiscabies]MDX3020448.1 biotin carboxylase N-terminal domain-containing protein [Streptomyces acidiscabies]MDX3789916.1 biotin carboxylase N-terminal domain-containing protei
MISTVLVANRGEIACRIFRTCRAAGIRTVAVHSDPDEGALHARVADRSVRLPGATPAETYLRGDLIVKAALASGADAVHPGYGFLSENAGFARAVLDAGLVWIGPPPEAIEAMASKTRAKALMGIAPLTDVTDADLPVLVKAAAGGGGRGMRIVRHARDLAPALEAARAEAASAFGDGEVFVEPYVERGRHVEVQILADTHGTVWALGTRDCSLQRRHQKVIEEAPAPGLSEPVARNLETLAVRAARAVSYAGAGTVEFLLAPDGTAHFLEMNTRLQVEHPVTEAVFGLDLVAEQIRVAEGAALADEPPPARGHAIEARLYAEDPAREWTPQTGTLHRLAVPDGVRLDTGYADGDAIGVHYDPLLAKVIAHAPTRAEALRKLAGALERATVHGPTTNRELLLRSLRHEEFTHARMDTGFYDRHLTALTRAPADPLAPLAAALADAHGRSRFGGWRNVRSQPQRKRYELDGQEHEVAYRHTRAGLDADGVRVVHADAGTVVLEADGVRHRFEVARYGDRVHVNGTALTALPRFPDPVPQRVPGSLVAPMPGTVVKVAPGLVTGSGVEAGEPIVWLEAMKMQHALTAPVSGTLTALEVQAGQQVEVGALLAVVEGDRQDETEGAWQ